MYIRYKPLTDIDFIQNAFIHIVLPGNMPSAIEWSIGGLQQHIHRLPS
jgi:hypothetical protein